MTEWKDQVYQKRGKINAHPYHGGENMDGVSISDADKANGSPKFGDMIASDPLNPKDRWLISEVFFQKNYELAG